MLRITGLFALASCGSGVFGFSLRRGGADNVNVDDAAIASSAEFRAFADELS